MPSVSGSKGSGLAKQIGKEIRSNTETLITFIVSSLFGPPLNVGLFCKGKWYFEKLDALVVPSLTNTFLG